MYSGYRGHLYKGNNYSKHHDYAQQSLIHLDLQAFINARFDAIPYDDSVKCKLADSALARVIDNNYRPTYIEPFASFLKKQADKVTKFKNDTTTEWYYRQQPKVNLCGELWYNSHSAELTLLSAKLKLKYAVDSVEFKYNLQRTYNASDDGADDAVIFVDYDVYVAKLVVKRSPRARPLYFSYAKVKTFRSNYKSGGFLGRPLVENTFEVHDKYFPVGLNMSQTINESGIYNDFVKAGRYMCKFLEYQQQIGDHDEKFPKVSHHYVYIADIYQKLFPYTYFAAHPELEKR